MEVALDVIVVDDGSARPHEAADYPGAVVIRNETNRGYTHATNRGIAHALADERTDAVLLLNNDLEFHGPILSRLIQELGRFDLVGPWGRFVVQGDAVPAPWLEFSCALVRTSVFRQIGLLDPRFEQGYYSDDDFCVRCHVAGLRVGQLGAANPPDLTHHQGSTHGSSRRDRIRASFPIFMEKWDTSEEPAVQSYIRNYLWNPNIRGFGKLPDANERR